MHSVKRPASYKYLPIGAAVFQSSLPGSETQVGWFHLDSSCLGHIPGGYPASGVAFHGESLTWVQSLLAHLERCRIGFSLWFVSALHPGTEQPFGGGSGGGVMDLAQCYNQCPLS